MTFATALKLGRVSNLPTVWTNALAGMALAGGWLDPAPLLLLLVAVSLAYVGGMFLNDAFDAEIDARQRRERPIPSGEARRETVFAFGFAMLGVSVILLALAGLASGAGLWPGAAGVALTVAIVAYDRHHKTNPLSPLVMGICRMLVYIAAGLCVTADLPVPVWIGAVLLLCHLIGLTYVAKQETLGRVANLWPVAFLLAPLAYGLALIPREPVTIVFWLALAGALYVAFRALTRRGPGDIGFAVMTLIAAISLLDAMLTAGTGAIALAVVAALGFPATLALQRFVRGT